MEQLIKINNHEGKQVVSARELYERLGYDMTQWARWYKKNITQNPFAIEGGDWVSIDIKSNDDNQTINPKPTKDFALTTDFAKKLSMMARTEIGDQIRDYFLECERQIDALKRPTLQSPEELLLQNVQLLIAHNNRLKEIECQQEKMAHENQQIFDKQHEIETTQQVISMKIEKMEHLLTWDEKIPASHFRITAYAREKGFKLKKNQSSPLGKKATELCNETKTPYFKLPNANYGHINLYPISILEKVFDEHFGQTSLDLQLS